MKHWSWGGGVDAEGGGVGVCEEVDAAAEGTAESSVVRTPFAAVTYMSVLDTGAEAACGEHF